VTSPDVHTSTGAHAADALPPEERAQVEQHLAECPACAQEVAELRAALVRLADAVPERPSPALRERVLAEVARTRQLPPVVGPGEGRARGRWWSSAPLQVAAAALLVVAVVLGVLLVQERRQLDHQRTMVAEVSTMLSDPHHVVTTATLTSGGRGTALVSGSEALFFAGDLPTVASDRTYQLWVMSPSSTRSAGLLGRGSSAQMLVRGLRDGDALGVTVEPSGGSTQPTSTELVKLPIGS
jgi:anti-sigma-K factor RskA